MNTQKGISRRKFIVTSGGITFLVASYPLAKYAIGGEDEKQGTRKTISAWVQLDTNGIITIFNPASEMGQGSMTALAVLVAEEMDADWSKVVIENSPVEPEIYGRGWGRSRKGGGSMITVGSHSVSGYYNNLRHAGAQARYVLLKNVADKWSVSLSELSTEPGMVLHKATGKKISYGEIAEFAVVPDSIPEIPEKDLKSPDQFRLIGKEIPRFDIPEKVNGTAMYAIDVRLSGMVYAVMTRSPVYGSKPSLINEDEIKSTSGVVDIVHLDHGIALVTNTIGLALSLRNKLDIKWSTGPKAESHTSDDSLEEYESIAGNGRDGSMLSEKGNVSQATSSAAKTYSFDYKNNYVYHAQMEPLNAVVSVSPDGKSAEVWAGTQAPQGARAAAAKVLGLDVSKVEFHRHYLGGGFGRRSMSDYVEETALIAKVVRKPVKLIWTREDDLKYGAYRPMCLQRMSAGLSKNGEIISWEHTIVGTGGGLLGSGASTMFYTFPNQKIMVKNIDHGIRTKHWRAVGHGPNKFAIESLLSEISIEEKIDPLTLRLNLMRDYPRAKAVLQKAADMAHWGENGAEGRARGIAFAERSGSLAAGVCEISVNKTSGKIKVHKVWCALDAGLVVQPNNVIAQTEGSILFGLSSVLYESITFKNGEVQQSNFHDYPLLRMADTPELIDIHIIKSNELPTGVGEAGLPWVGGAIADAVARLTGTRLRHMPFTSKRVLKALSS